MCKQKSLNQKLIPAQDPLASWVDTDRQKCSQAFSSRLIVISPLPPAKSGIADYTVALLEELKHFYEITVVCENDDALNTMNVKNFKTILARDYLECGNASDRHLYHFGNSFYHVWMAPLLERYPGVVVLHDIFLGGYMHAKLRNEGVTPIIKALFEEEGYKAISTYMKSDLQKVLFQYPMHKKIIDQSDSIIIHSAYARTLLPLSKHIYHVPFPKAIPLDSLQPSEAKQQLNIPPDTFLVCSFGFIGATKCSKEPVLLDS